MVRPLGQDAQVLLIPQRQAVGRLRWMTGKRGILQGAHARSNHEQGCIQLLSIGRVCIREAEYVG